ncbi:hypothetical protein GQX74_004928 [Glossina fuscipes]|nr:hypothetical protein GQX74_004928 [Glossina fuscipes]
MWLAIDAVWKFFHHPPHHQIYATSHQLRTADINSDHRRGRQHYRREHDVIWKRQRMLVRNQRPEAWPPEKFPQSNAFNPSLVYPVVWDLMAIVGKDLATANQCDIQNLGLVYGTVYQVNLIIILAFGIIVAECRGDVPNSEFTVVRSIGPVTPSLNGFREFCLDVVLTN